MCNCNSINCACSGIPLNINQEPIKQISDIILNPDNTLQFIMSDSSIITTVPIQINSPIYACNLVFDIIQQNDSKTAVVETGNLTQPGDQVLLEFGMEMTDGEFILEAQNQEFFNWNYPVEMAQNYNMRGKLTFIRGNSNTLVMTGILFLNYEDNDMTDDIFVLDQTIKTLNFSNDISFMFSQNGAVFKDININLIKRKA